MELADRSLHSFFLDNQGKGRAGIPRAQLLRFLGEAAEALDVINFEHGLQHLDVKPHNLFVISNHIKVADFGLVHRLPAADVTQSGHNHGGATPLYAAPETLQGSLSRQSDQYSLAIVYQQLLTGTVPFWSANPYQLLLQHISGTPDLSMLPPCDRPIVRRALSKAPGLRYASCTEFVQALTDVADPDAGVSAGPREAPAAAVAATLIVAPSARAEQATVPARHAADWSSRPSRPDLGAAEAENRGLELAQSSGFLLPGHRVLACVGRTPYGCLWTVQDELGRERLAHCLLNIGQLAGESMVRLQALHHAALPDREVLWAPPGCLVLISDLGRGSLRDRFEGRRRDGLPGIPRQTLLAWLAAAADALDELHGCEKLPHLGLNPAQLLIDGDRVLLEDFGLAPLLWLPLGRPAAQINPRYAAPELHEPGASAAADQYSVALIYAEMLTGVYPRLKMPGGKSGAHRRPGAEAGSGLHRRPPLPPNRPAGANGTARVDLDFLPADDRAAVARALHHDPTQRFPSCTAFIQALQAATPPPVLTQDVLSSLPLVTPFAQLTQKNQAQDAPVPTSDQVAAALIAASVGEVQVVEAENGRYIVHAGGIWEHRFPIRIFASLLRLKLEGFRQQWDARQIDAGADSFAFEIPTRSGKGLLWPSRRRPAGLHVRLFLQPADGTETNQREVVVQVGLFGDHGRRRETLLLATAPRIFHSLHAYLQGGIEHRRRERWPFAQRVGVYPVLAHLEIGQVVEARGRDVSLGGVRLLAAEEPPSEFAYLHFYETPKAAPLALLCRIVRKQHLDKGGCELGLTFAADGPLGA
jgi:serine/threonine protein kinase